MEQVWTPLVANFLDILVQGWLNCFFSIGYGVVIALSVCGVTGAFLTLVEIVTTTPNRDIKPNKREERREPVTFSEKRTELRSMEEHCVRQGDIAHMETSFLERYLALKKEIALEVTQCKDSVGQLCEKKHLSEEHRDLIYRIVDSASIEQAPLQDLMIAFVRANQAERCVRVRNPITLEGLNGKQIKKAVESVNTKRYDLFDVLHKKHCGI